MLAFRFEIFMIGNFVTSKVKGYCRDLVGSVQILAAPDEMNFLKNCKQHINEQVRKCLIVMGDHNNQRFSDNMSGVVVLCDDARFSRFVLDVPEELETMLETDL